MKKKSAPKHLKVKVPEPVKRPEPPKHLGLYFIIIFVVLLIAAGLIAWDKFIVRDIEIEGIENVNYLEVIHLSGIEYSSNIFTIDTDEVAKNIEQNPVLKVIDIKKKLPSTITITIEERAPVAVIKSDDKYIVINHDLIALSVQSEQTLAGNAEILGTAVTEYELGGQVTLEKEIHVKKLREILLAIETTEISQLIKTIDISFTENIKLYANAGYDIQIGGTDNIENKCLWIKTMIPTLIDEEKQGGTLFITNVNSAHYMGPNEAEND
jgi:cell division protein FtsQ